MFVEVTGEKLVGNEGGLFAPPPSPPPFHSKQVTGASTNKTFSVTS